MSDNDQDLFSPARRVKRPSTAAEPMSLQQPRAILPMPASAAEETAIQAPQIWAKRVRRSSNTSSAPERPDVPRPSTLIMADTTEQPTLPAAPKRGRKPGPLSKSAREAQRRLNHSIIEKARRTKINDALATLKQLVPPDYLQMKQRAADAGKEDVVDDEDDEDEEDYETNPKKSDKQKSKGKKQEKEKEFKLEILVRTVAFLQDLLKKVDDLETNTQSWAVVCQNCGSKTDSCRKRKRRDVDESHDDDADNTDREPSSSSPSSRAKVARMGDNPPQRRPTAMTASSPQGVPASTVRTERLPSISSWLDIDPQLLPAPVMNRSYTFPMNTSYLPSPPSSTHFDPVRTTTQVPPTLNLGPVATAMSVSSPGLSPVLTKSVDGHPPTVRTPEDETAASMLLHIATSPSFRPVSPSSSTGYALPDPTHFSLHSNVRSRLRDEEHVRQVETPSSILGIKKY